MSEVGPCDRNDGIVVEQIFHRDRKLNPEEDPNTGRNNGLRPTIWKVTIDDSYCAWEYEFRFPTSLSISMVKEAIREKFSGLEVHSRMVKVHYSLK